MGANAQVLIGTATDGNEFPFGTSAGNDYEQIYKKSDFSAPIDINEISFFLTLFTVPGFDTWATGDYSFYLSTTTTPVNQLVGNDEGANNQLFGTFDLSGAVPYGQINFTGTPFNYDPSQGNLLLDIKVTGQVPGQSSLVFLDAMDGDAGGIFSRLYNFGTGTKNYGLVTEFNGTPGTSSASVPDPASSLGLLSGACLVLGALRRKLS